ncbi:hypothetical protein ABJ384_04995 [Acinetobacter sp. A1-4-2]|uniref:Uncharacterized protein n=1 Tax=Acinetobacter sp. A1-4-2 TaxID=3156489 RepID=A0AAU7SZB7_9GAMM
MKRQIQARARAHSNPAQVLEHTPIYDLDAYFKQQQKLKFARFRKNLIQTLTFCCAVLFVSPILFMGG